MRKALQQAAIIFALLLALGFAAPALADEEIWDGTTDTSWYNTTDTQFVLHHPAQLAGLAQIVSGKATGITKDNFSGKTVTLGCDMSLNDMSGSNWTAGAHKWTPIGVDNCPFSGTFDGGGHTVSGLYLDSNITKHGFFGYVFNAKIRHLTISGSVNVAGRVNYIGGVIGHSAKSEIYDCQNYCDVSGPRYVGGVVGYLEIGSAYNCSNYGNISGTIDFIGGVYGDVHGETYNCFNAGSVASDATGASVGGISGWNYETQIFNSCSTGSVSGTISGGVLGHNGGTGCHNCYFLRTDTINPGMNAVYEGSNNTSVGYFEGNDGRLTSTNGTTLQNGDSLLVALNNWVLVQKDPKYLMWEQPGDISSIRLAVMAVIRSDALPEPGDAANAVLQGEPAARWQWQIRADGSSAWVDIPGASAASYTLTAEDAGKQLRVAITSEKSATYTSAPVTVCAYPAFKQEPTPQTVMIGNKATFSALAAGFPAPSYRWQESLDGVNWVDIPGATGNVYETAAATPEMNARLYRCVAESTTKPKQLHQTVSAAAALTVTLPISIKPRNDFSFGNAPKDLTVTVGEGTGLKFSTDFENATINDRPIFNGVEFDGEDGSILLHFHKDYLNSLAPGTYLLRVSVFGGASASTTIVVCEPTANIPETADRSSPILWAVLAGLAGIGYYVHKKRRRHAD